MAVAQYLPEVGNLAHFPQQADRAGMHGQRSDLLFAGERLQSALIVGLSRLDESGNRGPLVKALQQCRNRPGSNGGISWRLSPG